MELRELISEYHPSTEGRIRRASWPEGQHLRVKNDKIIVYRFANSTVTWNWQPTQEELCADDWERAKL